MCRIVNDCKHAVEDLHNQQDISVLSIKSH